jgi:hypothetical protein
MVNVAKTVPRSMLSRQSGGPTMKTVFVPELQLKHYTLYTYDIQRWRSGRVVEAQGSGSDGPYTPEYTIGRDERFHKETGRYVVDFVAADGTSYSRRVGEKRWSRIGEAAECRLLVTRRGTVIAFWSTASAPATSPMAAPPGRPG